MFCLFFSFVLKHHLLSDGLATAQKQRRESIRCRDFFLFLIKRTMGFPHCLRLIRTTRRLVPRLETSFVIRERYHEDKTKLIPQSAIFDCSSAMNDVLRDSQFLSDNPKQFFTFQNGFYRLTTSLNYENDTLIFFLPLRSRLNERPSWRIDRLAMEFSLRPVISTPRK